MQNKHKREPKQPEMRSLNEDVFNMFSIEELEARLQTTAVAPWVCGTHDNDDGCKDYYPGCGCFSACPLDGQQNCTTFL